MRALLIFSVLFAFCMRATDADELPATTNPALACPEQYELMTGERSICIRPLYLWENDNLIDLLPKSRNECGKAGATLPVIKSNEENEIYNQIVNTFDEIQGWNVKLVLDIVCNTTTRRLQWVDGSSIAYSPFPGVNSDFDCVSTDKSIISETKHDDWQLVWSGDSWSYTVLCVAEPTVATTTTTLPPSTTRAPGTVPTAQPGTQCGDYSLMESPLFGSCFKLYDEPMPWIDAENECACGFGSLTTINSQEENKFMWRTAVSNGFAGGVHIGAHQPAENPKNWTWVDGEVPIEGNVYDNFIGSFPIPGAGKCAALLTESSSALWINEDCKEDALPFICRRSDFSAVPKSCPKDAPPSGEDFYPPGFPDAVKSCEYILFAAAQQLVEIEVKTLVAESNRDFLEIYEGPVGTNLLANLTGSILSSVKFTTAKSNVMRVNWKAFGAGTNRGFKAQYNEVEP